MFEILLAVAGCSAYLATALPGHVGTGECFWGGPCPC